MEIRKQLFKNIVNSKRLEISNIRGDKNVSIVDYINNLSSQSILIKRFDNVGHNIQSEEFEQLARSVEEFLISID